jgi:hypothetical protein
MRITLIIESHRQAQRACGLVAARDLGAKRLVCGLFLLALDCCSLGEACLAERCRTETGRPRRRRTDVSFALRTSVHNLNRMPPCLSADSQRSLCNCCHRPGPRARLTWFTGGRRPGGQAQAGRGLSALFTCRGRWGRDPLCWAGSAAAPARARGGRRKYQSGLGCCRRRKRVGPGYLRRRPIRVAAWPGRQAGAPGYGGLTEE